MLALFFAFFLEEGGRAAWWPPWFCIWGQRLSREPAESGAAHIGQEIGVIRVWQIPGIFALKFLVSACPIDFEHGPMVMGFEALRFFPRDN